MSQADRIREHLLSSAAQLSHTADTLTTEIMLASERMSECLLGGGRILSCGIGSSGLFSQYLCTLLLNRLQRDRPGLPAISLNADAALLNAISRDYSFSEVFARQIRSLGQEGDCLVMISSNDRGQGHDTLMQAVRDRGLKLIVLDDEQSMPISDLLESDDIEISAPTLDAAGCREIHLAIIHSLCELIDLHIFGDTL